MSIKIKVSYEHLAELQWVKEKFEKDIINIKESQNQSGKYKKAYIELKNNGEMCSSMI